jgi:type II secretory pathway pseudopilin PulG
MNRKTHTPLGTMFYIVLTIIIILVVAVVLPNFFRSRRCSAAEACIANMRQLEGAREQALLANFSASIKGSPATHSTTPVHAVYGPVASPRLFDDCPGKPLLPSDPATVHSVYK